MEQADILKEAMKQGYNPDYNGPNAKTPEQFVEDGKKIAPVMAERNKELISKIDKLEQQQREMMEQQFKMNEESRELGYRKAMKELKDKKFEAVSEANVEAVASIEKEEEELRKNHTKTVTKEQPKADPEYVEWHKENKWFKPDLSNEESIFADSIFVTLQRTRPDLHGKALYDETKKRVAFAYPEIAGKKPDNHIDDSSHSGSTKQSAGGKLPPEAQKKLNQDIKNLKLSEKEQENWKKQYWGLNE